MYGVRCGRYLPGSGESGGIIRFCAAHFVGVVRIEGRSARARLRHRAERVCALFQIISEKIVDSAKFRL
jgi:hypothetical protein